MAAEIQANCLHEALWLKGILILRGIHVAHLLWLQLCVEVTTPTQLSSKEFFGVETPFSLQYIIHGSGIEGSPTRARAPCNRYCTALPFADHLHR